MPESAAYARFEVLGGVPDTTLNGDISSGATSITITSGTSWPTGSPGPFQVTIDRNLSTEEDIEVASRSGNVLTVNARGINNTTAAAHSSGAVIEVTIGKRALNEANYWVAELATAIDAKGTLPVGDADNSLVGLAVGADDRILMADTSTASGLKWAAAATTAEIADLSNTEAAGTSDTYARGDHVHAYANAAWTTFTPTLEQGAAVATSATIGRYLKIGRLAVLNLSLISSAAGTAGQPIEIASIPAAIAPWATGVGSTAAAAWFLDDGAQFYTLTGYFISATELRFKATAGASDFGASPAVTLASGDQINVTVTYETT